MKTYRNLFDSIISFENLFAASRKARRGKRWQTNVGVFEVDLEKELLSLREELQNRTYKPGSYTEFYIVEPKKRKISAAPYRDRVVHHALCNIIEPLFERSFIFDSYANRKNKGTHRGIVRCQKFARRNRYVLQCDIRKFFPSIDHSILKEKIRRRIASPSTLWLIDTIIDNSNEQERVLDYYPGDTLFTPVERHKGLPIGNLTSQFFGNLYMDGLDHFVKEILRCRHYLRYVDDFLIFGQNKSYLHVVRERIRSYLERCRLGLQVNKTTVYPVTEGIPWLGQRVFPEFRLLKKQNVIRFRRRLRHLQERYSHGDISVHDVSASVHGWLGHARWADTYRLRKAILGNAHFVRG